MAEEFTRYVITFAPNLERSRDEDLIRRHVAFLRALDRKGQLLMAGPFADGSGGMIILTVDSLEAATRIALSDPFVESGHRSFAVREWQLSNEDNNHMGMG